MKGRARKSGMSLTEMTVVVAVVAMLVALSGPAIRTLSHSLVSAGDAKAMISAALASARAIAAKEQRYAGIRFQKAYDPNNLTGAAQYMIFIVHDFNDTGLAYGFRAVENIEPIKLPEGVGVMDLRINKTEIVDTDGEITNDEDVIDTTAFSVLFSPSGKLVIHGARIRNRDGWTNTDSEDDIFNVESNVKNGIGLFIQDDYQNLGLYEEPSRNSFIIYEKNKFDSVNKNSRYDDYLKSLDVIYINPYTGTMIDR